MKRIKITLRSLTTLDCLNAPEKKQPYAKLSFHECQGNYSDVDYRCEELQSKHFTTDGVPLVDSLLKCMKRKQLHHVYNISSTARRTSSSNIYVLHSHASYEKSLIVLSMPQVRIHGWFGWNSQSNVPISELLVVAWQCSTFTGTISGFCSRSLKRKTIYW
jgi:hypothetical protein